MKIVSLLVLSFLLIVSAAQANNLVIGGNMESEDGWNITDFKDNGSLDYEFGYTDDTPAFGYGGCLHIYQGEDAGQFLLWQRVKVIAGQKYRVTGALKLIDWNGGENGGTWYQMYTSPEEVDVNAGEYNPVDQKILDVGEGWDRESGFFDNTWEAINLSTAIETAPYFIPEGTPGEEVEITFAIKFGQYWPDYTGTFFEILVDEVGLYPVEEAVNAGGDMESEDGWNITDFKDNGSLDYEFGYTDDTPLFGHGGCLHIYQGEDAGQFLLWQRVKVIAGQKYRATGTVKLIDWNGGANGGTWYQMYTSTEEVDVNAGEYNPVDDKIFDVGDGWDRESGMFEGLWEELNLSEAVETAPYYIPPGNPGEEVEITFAIKFGQYWPDYSGTFYDFLVDEVYLLAMEEGASTDVEKDPAASIRDYQLFDNYPNPFNPSTKIDYTIPTSTKVRLTVYDVLGHEVATLVNDNQTAGRHSVVFDASDLTSGVYFYRLEAGNKVFTKKLTLMK